MPGDGFVDVTNVQSHTHNYTQDLDEPSTFNGEIQTETSVSQGDVEQDVFLLRKQISALSDGTLRLHRERHVSWLLRALENLPERYSGLFAAQPWLCFWIVHALDLLGAEIPENTASRLVMHLRSCRDDETGGFGGGPGQTGHLASTYAAVAALCTIGTPDAYDAIDLVGLHSFLRTMKTPMGGFRVSTRGESDVRAMYSALAVASLTGILSRDPSLFDGCAEYVTSLQSFDGGFGGEPGNEAHGGNSYCATASLVILGQLDVANNDALLDWTVMRQMPYEGGFQGRTNKLVDSCYSFWVGAMFPLLGYANASVVYHPINTQEAEEVTNLFDGNALQRYILECAQVRRGGFRDKPGVPPDYLHTCYALSGLSIAQEFGGASVTEGLSLKPTDPVYNLSRERAIEARLHFDSK